MGTVSYAFAANFDVDVPLLIVGAGAAGLCAALAAKETGIAPLVIERDTVPAGSTALSAGTHSCRGNAVPACQRHHGQSATLCRRHSTQSK